jgi:hypothetical protein
MPPTSARIRAAPAGPMPGRSISCDPDARTACFSSALNAFNLASSCTGVGQLLGGQPRQGASDVVTRPHRREQHPVLGHRSLGRRPARQQLGEQPVQPVQSLSSGLRQFGAAVAQQPQHHEIVIDGELAQTERTDAASRVDVERSWRHAVRPRGGQMAALPGHGALAINGAMRCPLTLSPAPHRGQRRQSGPARRGSPDARACSPLTGNEEHAVGPPHRVFPSCSCWYSRSRRGLCRSGGQRSELLTSCFRAWPCPVAAS